MQVISFELDIQSPLVLTSLSGDENTISTEKYISGSSLLGALASIYIKEKNFRSDAHTDKNFYEWFLSGKIQFENVYPLGKDEYKNKYSYYPTPYFFQYDKKDKDADNFDNLFTNRDSERTYKSKEDLSVIRNDKEIHFASLQTIYNFHHERNYSTGISKEGKIFTYESLEKGYIFFGSISGDSEPLNSLLAWLGKERILYIGRSKNSQYGKVKLKVIEKDIGELSKIEDNFILTLTSDLILYNENGFPTTDVRYFLKNFNGCEFVKVEREKNQSSAIIKSKSINGFHGAWRLKRNTDIAFQAGSSFYFNIIDSTKKEEIRKQIQSLAQTGIGERTQEGFGRFTIYSDEIFNLNTDDKIKPITAYNESITQSITDSREVKELIESVYRAELKKLVQKKVQFDIDKLKVKNVKSSFVSHILSFLNKDTGRFEYRSKNHNQDKKHFKELHRALERNVDRLSINGQFLFEYFEELKLNPDTLIALQSDMDELRKDYPFLKNLSIEKELNFTYFKTFVSSLRKKIKQNKPREMQGDKK